MYTRLVSILIIILLATPVFAQTTVRGERDDTSPATCVEGAQCNIRETTNRAFHVNIRNDSGAELGTATDPVNVEGTLACTLSEPISVDDNGGSLTVDATNFDIRDLTAVSDNVAISDGSETATVRDTGASDSLNVAIVDATGTQITSFGGGGVQYTEGDVDATFTGNIILGEGSANTAVAIKTEDNGAAHVNLRTSTNLELGTASDPMDVEGIVIASVTTEDGTDTIGSNPTPFGDINDLRTAPTVGYTVVGYDAVEAGSTDIGINATAHSAIRGDVILMTSGALKGRYSWVDTTAANSFTVQYAFDVDATFLGTGDTFAIYRPKFLTSSPIDPTGGNALQIAPPFIWQPRVNDTAETGSTTTVIQATAHEARVGDLILFFTGDNAFFYYATVIDTDTDEFTVDIAFPNSVDNGDQFTIYSHDILVTDGAHALQVTETNPQLPPNAATETTLSSIDSNLSSFTNIISAEGFPYAGGEGIIPGGVFVRRDTPSVGTAADGDFAFAGLDSSGRLWVNGSSVTQPISGSVTVSGSVTADTELSTAAALADNTANPTVTSTGSFAHWFDGTTWDRARGDSTDGLLVNLGANNDITLSEPISVDDNGGSLTVDGTVAVSSITTSVTPGTAAANLGKAEDDPAANADTGVAIFGRRNDLGTATIGADGDYGVLSLDSAGRLAVTDGGNSLTIDGSISQITASVNPGTAATNLGKAEDSAHATTDTGVAVWGVRNDSAATTYGANNDYTPIATDANGRVGVADLGGSVTVDISDGVETATVRDTGTDDSLNVAIVDASGNQITSFGGGTQYTEGDTDASITGTAMMMEGAANTLVAAPGTAADGLLVNLGANNDVTLSEPISVDDNGGSLTVDGTISGTGTFTTSDTATLVDDAGFTPATSRVLMAGFEFDDVAPDSVNEGDGGAVRMSANRNLYSTIRDAAGNERGANVNASSQLTVSVDNTIAVGNVATIGTSVTPGTAAVNLGKAEDAASASGDTGVGILGVRNDAAASLTTTDGDYGHIWIDSRGQVQVGDGVGALTIDGSIAQITTSVSPGTAAGNLGKAEDAAHASSDVGVATWAVRNDSGSTTFGANGDYSPIAVDANGRVGISALGGTFTVDTELPATAALADNTANPTITGAASYPHWFDGSTWDRAAGTSTDGLLVNLGANNDIIQSTASNLNAQVVGATAHDAADADNPIKTGGKAFDFETSAAGTRPGQAAVAANDRTNLALTLRGETPVYAPAIYNEPDNIDTTYDDSPTSATSSAIDIDGYNYHCFGFELDKANTPTDIVIAVQLDLGDGNWKKIMNDWLGDWRYDDTAVGSGVDEVMCFSATGDQIRIVVTAAGTTAANTFTIANSVLRSTVMR